MNFYYGISAALTGAAIVLVQPQIAVALTANQVNKNASEISVVVDGINPGSGVIVAKNGNTYYVLTAKHVVETEDEYAIATPDGRHSEALLAYDKSIAIAPENYQLWMLRAAALIGLKRNSEARKSAQQALKLKPNDRDILNFINAIDPRSSNSVSANSILNRRRFERLNPPKPAPGLLW